METGLRIETDVVVVGFYLNDAQDSPAARPVRLPAYLRWSRVAALLAERQNVPLLDTLPLLRRSHRESDEPLLYDHAHHTPRGQALLAEAILEFIRSNP